MLYVGTCGFSYKDWIGPFYPRGIKAAAMLPFYAGRFSAVEIDSTYYAIPKPALFEGMVARTPTDFRFTVKAPGSVTHLPSGASADKADFDAFSECVAPLARAGRLGAVLVQFPGAFRPSREAWHRLRSIRDRWLELPLVAEFRSGDWQRDDALREVRDLGFGWCNVDEPRLGPLMHPSAETTSAIGYVRFHGRNAEKWWKQDRSPAERYDYLYSVEQMTEWLPLIARVESRTRDTYVFFNNHRNGQAGVNAWQMAELLGVRRQNPLPDENADRADLELPLD
jgi:uncharacterized protein YecE (DUF72 family)